MPENKVARLTLGIGSAEIGLAYAISISTHRDLLWREEKPAGRFPDSLSFICCVEGTVWKSQISAG